jgi:hypothetical protein
LVVPRLASIIGRVPVHSGNVSLASPEHVDARI